MAVPCMVRECNLLVCRVFTIICVTADFHKNGGGAGICACQYACDCTLFLPLLFEKYCEPPERKSEIFEILEPGKKLL